MFPSEGTLGKGEKKKVGRLTGLKVVKGGLANDPRIKGLFVHSVMVGQAIL